MCCRQLIFQHLHTSVSRQKQIALHPRPFAVDSFLVDDRFNFVDRRGMTLRGESRTFFTKQTLKFIKTIVERVGEMRGGARCHAAPNRSVVQNHD